MPNKARGEHELTVATSLDVPSYADVESAAARIAGIAHRTPVLTSSRADLATGARLFFKMESLQKGGAFKFRGAFNAISRLDSEARRRGIVAYSSGNHAQAAALASRLLGVRATIVMPDDAPAGKLAATRGYGARVVTYDRHDGDREAIAAELVAREGFTLIPPFDHPHVIAGQGTAARELIEEVGPLDYLYVPVGGGGLISGVALAAAALSPGCRVIGVEPQAGDDARRSLAAREIVRIPTPATIADGAQTRSVGGITFAVMREHVAAITTASDDALRRQMRFFLEAMKQLVEPTGCLGAAAAMAEAPKGARVGVIVSGGNVDVAALGAHIAAISEDQHNDDPRGGITE